MIVPLVLTLIIAAITIYCCWILKRDRIRAYFRRRRMKLAGQDPDRILTRQERRHLEQRLAKQMRRAAYGSAKSHRI